MKAYKSLEGKKKFMWRRVGGGSERRVLVFGSGYSTQARKKKENKIKSASKTYNSEVS